MMQLQILAVVLVEKLILVMHPPCWERKLLKNRR